RTLGRHHQSEARRADDLQEPAPVRLPLAQQIRAAERAVLRLPARRGGDAGRRRARANRHRAVIASAQVMRILPLLLVLTCATPSTSPQAASSAPRAATDYDIRIINGDAIDGSGSARVRADVGIRGDAIAKIGDLAHATARRPTPANNRAG